MKKRFNIGFLFSLPLIFGASLILTSCDLFNGGSPKEDGFHVRLINPDGSVERDIHCRENQRPSLGNKMPYFECDTPGNFNYYVGLEENINKITTDKDVKIIYEEAAKVRTDGNYYNNTAMVIGLNDVTPKHVKLPHHVWYKTDENLFGYVKYEVNGIGKEAFTDLDFESIEINDQITYIGDEAFANCDKLTSITIPKSAEFSALAKGVFRECDNLKEVTFENEIDDIPPEMFMNCKKLEKVNNYNYKFIPRKAFYNCESLDLTNIDFSKITRMGNQALTGVTKFPETLDLSNCILGDEAITSAPTIKKVILNKNLTELNCFQNCENLEEVNFSELTNLEKLSGFDGTKISSLDLTNLKKLKYLYNFDNTPINSLKLSESLVEIVGFDGCEGLTEIDFTVSPHLSKVWGFNECELDVADFSNCRYLDNIYSVFKHVNTLKLERDLKNRIDNIDTIELLEGDFAKPLPFVKKVIFPKDMEYIQDNLFEGNLNLETIDIPDSITTIGANAFKDAKNLKEVNFTKNSKLSLIKKSAFYNCFQLTKFKFENLHYLNKVEFNAIENTRLKSILPCRAVTFESYFPKTVAAFYMHEGSTFKWMHINCLLISDFDNDYPPQYKYQCADLMYEDIYEDEDGFLYYIRNQDASILRYYGDNRSIVTKDKITLPNGKELVVNDIWDNAFSLDYASKIVISNNVRNVGTLVSKYNNIKILEIGTNAINKFTCNRRTDIEGNLMEDYSSVYSPRHCLQPNKDAIDPTNYGNYIDVINHATEDLLFGYKHRRSHNGHTIDESDSTFSIGVRCNNYDYEIVDGFIFMTKKDKDYCVGYIGSYQYEITFPERSNPYKVAFYIKEYMCKNYKLPENATYDEDSIY